MTTPMNGAQTLIQTLCDAGVNVCFANPGTSEMHFVAALDTVPSMRGVLTLFEGVATGAADGYGRMTGKPAATLLHLGPGLANGLANFHNAMRARTPIVNVVGDHATYHKKYDAPLESDVEAYAKPVSAWIRSSQSANAVAGDAADAVAAAMGPPGGIASLILPADVSWLPAERPAAPRPIKARASVAGAKIDGAKRALTSGQKCALLLGGSTLLEPGLMAASRLAEKTSAKLLCDTFPARLERGAGLPNPERLAYLAEMTVMQLEGIAHLIVVDSKAPVSFFAYPGKPSYLVPDGCEVHVLADHAEDAVGALESLCDALGAKAHPPKLEAASRPALGSGALSSESIARTIGVLLPEGAIVSDEGNTAGLFVPFLTSGAPRHSWLCLTGGSIGQGMPVATGAAVACPGRKVINLQADGSAMYTAQALWTQAREKLDVTTVVFANRSYAILNMELSRVGATPPGPKALSMLDLSNPVIDFAGLARSLGVDGQRVTTAEEFTRAFSAAMSEPGPHLIEAVI
jgi:acetolactate synthase-1/2/3 large subunit